MPYMKTEGVSDNSIFSYVLVCLLRGNTGTTFQITSRSIGEVTVEKIGKSAVFFGGGVTTFCVKNRIKNCS